MYSWAEIYCLYVLVVVEGGKWKIFFYSFV